MNTKDSSDHKKYQSGDVIGSLKQGNDTDSNPGHGEGTARINHSIKHGSPESKYFPSGLDPHREHPFPSNDDEESKGEH